MRKTLCIQFLASVRCSKWPAIKIAFPSVRLSVCDARVNRFFAKYIYTQVCSWLTVYELPVLSTVGERGGGLSYRLDSDTCIICNWVHCIGGECDVAAALERLWAWLMSLAVQQTTL